MFHLFERLIDPVASSPTSPPATSLLAFYWHFVRQTKGLYLAMFATGLLVALLDMLIPVFLGWLVTLMAAEDRARAISTALPWLIGTGVVILFLRPVAVGLDSVVRNSAIMPGTTSLIRWQSHWHVLRQSWPFFQNDFAGRIATRVIQTSNALRDSVISGIRAVWYIVVYGTGAMVLMAQSDIRLALPVLVWFIGYVFFLWYFVPRLRDLSRASSEVRSKLTGRVVDSYTNILTVKLFARAADEDAYVRETVAEHHSAIAAHGRITTRFNLTLSSLNALLLVSTAAVAVYLWGRGWTDSAAVATALSLTWQIINMAGWASWEVATIFENVGVVQEGMETIAAPHTLVDKPEAKTLRIRRGEILFEGVGFGYGRERNGVIQGLNLPIQPGERVGLIGRSGAGKSTLVSLLLRLYDVERGRILIDGQNIKDVTQESLRAGIAMVTQDTSLLHRSIAENIRYGRPEATDAEVETAARQAHAHEFILSLEDWKGRRGYAAHTGERGAKLSGGQRQRIAIARVILKDAPILILDEATSALDSEVEAAIQEQLEGLMRGKTVLAIAHRLSTIAALDRLVVLDQGKILEEGSHEELLARGGVYADLWTRQSGGFIAKQARMYS